MRNEEILLKRAAKRIQRLLNESVDDGCIALTVDGQTVRLPITDERRWLYRRALDEIVDISAFPFFVKKYDGTANIFT